MRVIKANGQSGLNVVQTVRRQNLFDANPIRLTQQAYGTQQSAEQFGGPVAIHAFV